MRLVTLVLIALAAVANARGENTVLDVHPGDASGAPSVPSNGRSPLAGSYADSGGHRADGKALGYRHVAIRDRADLLTAYPHLFPSCQALLHILERTDEGRIELQELRAPLHRLQYLRRTVRQHELDLDMLDRPEREWFWEPYLPVGLRWRREEQPGAEEQQHAQQGHGSHDAFVGTQPQSQTQAQQGAGLDGAQQGGQAAGAGAQAAGGAAALPREPAPTDAGRGPAGDTAQSQEADAGAAAVQQVPAGQSAAAAAQQGAAGRQDAAGLDAASMDKGAPEAAAAAAAAAAEAAVDAAEAAAALVAAVATARTSSAMSTGGTGYGNRLRLLSEEEEGEHTGGDDGDRADGGDGKQNSHGATTAGDRSARPILRIAERVLRGRTDAAELKAELDARRAAAHLEVEALGPQVEARLERLRGFLRAAANASGNASEVGSSATGSASNATDPTNITVDPNDLELYDLLLAPCAQAQLDPARYESYPPRPLVSFLLPYSGRRLPYVVGGVVEPLLSCVVGQAEAGGALGAAVPAAASGQQEHVAGSAAETQGGDNTTSSSDSSGAGADGRRLRLLQLDGRVPQSDMVSAVGGLRAAEAHHDAAAPAPAPPLELELLVAFDEPEEAAGWATVAAESGGRVVPLFRPAGTAEGAASASGAASAGSAAPTLGLSGSVPPLSQAVNRLAAAARSDVLVLLRDGDALPADLCEWLRAAARAFHLWPRLGALGSGAFVLDWHPGADNRGLAFWDAANGLPLQFVATLLGTPDVHSGAGGPPGDGDCSAAHGGGGANASDGRYRDGGAGGGGLPLLAVRRAAWQQLGGLDAGLGGGVALCSGCAAIDLSTRLWLSGWQVAHMPASARPLSFPPNPMPAGEPAGATPAAGAAAASESDCCSQLPPVARTKLEYLCARQLQLRYGRSPYWEDREDVVGSGGHGQQGPAGAVAGGAAGGPRGGAARAWFLGSELHARITELVAQLNVARLQRLHWGRWECPFGAVGCEGVAATSG